MPTRRDGTRPATRKELLSAIAGEDVSDMRLTSLRRMLVCLDRRPDLRDALSTAIAVEWVRDTGTDPDGFPVLDAVGAAVIKDLRDMAADFERVLDREGVH